MRRAAKTGTERVQGGGAGAVRRRGRPRRVGSDQVIRKLRLGTGPLTESERKWVRRDRLADAAAVRPRTLQEVADLLGVTTAGVWAMLARQGITGRPPGLSGHVRFKGGDEVVRKLRLGTGPLTDDERKWVRPDRLADASVIQPRTLQEVGDLLGINPRTVWAILSRHGITGRPPGLRQKSLSLWMGRDEVVRKLRLGTGPLTDDERKWVRPERLADASVVRPRTLREVGDLLGVTRERVRQILRRAGITARPSRPERRRTAGEAPEKMRAARREWVKQARAGASAPAEAVAQLARWFRSSGYVRRQDPQRLAEKGYMGYKKGDEVRLVADSLAQLRLLRRLLRQAGFNPGRPFVHSNQWRQPLYGRHNVTRFLALVAQAQDPQPGAADFTTGRAPQPS